MMVPVLSLMQLMDIKQVAHCEPIFYETDLLNYIESYQQPTDDELYQSSLMLQPKKQTNNKRAGKRMSIKIFDRDKIIHEVQTNSQPASSSAPANSS